MGGIGSSSSSGRSSAGGQASTSTISAAQIQQSQQNADRQNRINFLLAPIKSKKDLAWYLSSHAHTKTPLDDLSAPAKTRFIEALVFTDSGLGSFDYKDLENELTPTQIYQVLSLFGAQGATAELSHAEVRSETDRLLISQVPTVQCYKDHECVEPHTCSFSNFDCCTSNC